MEALISHPLIRAPSRSAARREEITTTNSCVNHLHFFPKISLTHSFNSFAMHQFLILLFLLSHFNSKQSVFFPFSTNNILANYISLLSLALAAHSSSSAPSSTNPYSTYPKCAQSCIASAVSHHTKCAATDRACQCQPSNVAAIGKATAGCVLDHCGLSVALGITSFSLPQNPKLCE